jgi:hypothetical protein
MAVKTGADTDALSPASRTSGEAENRKTTHIQQADKRTIHGAATITFQKKATANT